MSHPPTARIPRSKPDRSGWVRRADVSLRASYPNLVTRIFEATSDEYLIVFDKTLQESASIDFEEFRPVTLRARISNELPKTFVREIRPISDSGLALNFEGFPFSNLQLSNLLIARFPELPIAALYDGGTPMTVTVELTTAITAEQESALLAFCAALNVPAPFRIVVTGRTLEQAQAALKPTVSISQALQPDPMLVGASRLRPRAPTFVQLDERYWFDNLDSIYAGRLSVEEMPGISDGDARCYLDATLGDHINFRQLLAYYDTVYFSPPLVNEHQGFLARQALTEADLLTLIESGRLRVLQTQPEERLDIPFLEAVSERAPDAIIGRRTAAAILIADIVRTAGKYRLNDPEHFAAIGQLSSLIAEKSGVSHRRMLQQLLWPIEARRNSVAPFLNRGTKGILTVGLGPHVASMIQKMTGKDVEFDAMMLSEKVHIAHAINATCFPMHQEPPPWTVLSNTIGEALNFYRSFNTEIVASWVGNVGRKQQGKLLLPPLDILAFDADVPLADVLDATNRPVMRNRARGLFSRLANMGDEERANEIREITAALRKFGQPRGIMSLDSVDTGVSLASFICHFVWPPILGIGHLGAQLVDDLATRNPAVDKFIEKIRIDLFPQNTKRRELDFLSRISRVATLRKRTVS